MITINIDFDGTCVTHEFPNVGKNIGAEIVLKELIQNDIGLILFTMRCNHPEGFIPKNDPGGHSGGTYLQDAIEWFKQHELPLYGIQSDPNQDEWTTSPKSYASFMIDDSAIGTPMSYKEDYSERHFVDWLQISRLLLNIRLITTEQQMKIAKNIFLKYPNLY